MSIYPQGEDLRKAIKWISEEREPNQAGTNSADNKKKIAKLVDEACIKFDLSPNDGEFLCRWIMEQNQE